MTMSLLGADIGSDHDLVMMTFQVRLKARKPNQPRLRFDLEKLRGPCVAYFPINNRLEIRTTHWSEG